MEPAVPHPSTFPDDARCLSCGYSLFGLPEPRCPECGRVFDRGNPLTFSSKTFPNWVRRRLKNASAMGQIPIYWGMGLTFLAGLPLPGTALPMVVGIALILLGGPIRGLAVQNADTLALLNKIPWTPPRRRAWISIVGVAFLLGSITAMPSRVLFWLHRDGLADLARQIHHREPLVNNEVGVRRVGLLTVSYRNTPTGISMIPSIIVKPSPPAWNRWGRTTADEQLIGYKQQLFYSVLESGLEEIEVVSDFPLLLPISTPGPSLLHRGPLPPGYP